MIHHSQRRGLSCAVPLGITSLALAVVATSGCDVIQSKFKSFLPKNGDSFTRSGAQPKAFLLLPLNDTIPDAAKIYEQFSQFNANPYRRTTSQASADIDAPRPEDFDVVTTAFKNLGQCWYLVPDSAQRTTTSINLKNIDLSLPARQADALEVSQLITKNYVPLSTLISALKRDPLLKKMSDQYQALQMRLNATTLGFFSGTASNTKVLTELGNPKAAQKFLLQSIGSLSAETLFKGEEDSLHFWTTVVETAEGKEFKTNARNPKRTAPRKELIKSASRIFNKAQSVCFQGSTTSRLMALACATELVTVLSAAVEGSVQLWSEKSAVYPTLFRAENIFVNEFSIQMTAIKKEGLFEDIDLAALSQNTDGQRPDGVLRRLGRRPGAPCPSPAQAARNLRAASSRDF